MLLTMQTPYLDEVVVSGNGREHLMIRAILSINRVHYVVFIPLVTDTEYVDYLEEDGDLLEWDDDWDEEDWGDVMDEAEPLGFGRLVYDYANLEASIEPLYWESDGPIIDRIMTVLAKIYGGGR